tara:strand:+ start:5196 stop:5810 length:615 start_codon:yes stop_codon:yes gene_type:complete
MQSNEEITRRIFDVDIDTSSKTKREDYGVRAMIYNDKVEKVLPHPSGVYIEKVPVDPETGLCSFDYEYGNTEGFMKVDILSNSSYDNFKSKEELLYCLEIEPDWKLLLDKEFATTLPHIGKYHELLVQLRPSSIEELADFLALIRPAKIKHLGDYKKNKNKVRRKLYLRPTDGSAYFKRSHAISYAMMIVAIMNHRSNTGTIQW